MVPCYNRRVSEHPQGGPGSIFIIDANNYVFRAYHALPMLTSPDGTPINAVHGFVRMLQALRGDFSPEHIVAVFDAPGPSFRDEMYDAYKANRPPAPEDLRPQFPLVRDATRALGVPLVEVPGVEADDAIATYALAARQAGMRAYILSSDKDLMQLVDEPGEDGSYIRLYDGMKRRLVGPSQVRDKYHGIGPSQLGDLLALMGDSADNVPGVPGIGPKTAAALLLEFGDLEGVLEAAPSLKQKKRRERLMEHAEDARLSRRLVELKRDVELPLDFEGLRDPGIDVATVTAFFTPLGFKTTLAGMLKGGGSPIKSSRGTGSGAAPAPSAGGGLPSATEPLEVGEHAVLLPGDRAALERWLTAAAGARAVGVVALGNHDEPMRADLVGVALSADGCEPPNLYLPVGHRNLEDAGTEMWTPADLGPSLQSGLAGAHLQAHDAKTQGVLLAEAGVGALPVEMDSMLASYTLDPARGAHDVASLAGDVLGHTLTPLERIVGKGRKQVPIDQVRVTEVAPYAAELAACARALGAEMRRALDDVKEGAGRLFDDVELPLSGVLERLERPGWASCPRPRDPVGGARRAAEIDPRSRSTRATP